MNRKSTKKMFELATDFSKLPAYPKFLDINPKWDYEESQKQATRYIKSLICRNIEIPNDEPNVRNDGLEWKINPTIIKRFLDIINNIDVRHWEYIGYTSLRNTGVYSWDEAVYGEYHLTLSEQRNVSDDDRFLFGYLYISIYTNSISILCAVTNRFTKERKSKEFNNSDDFIDYYNYITKNKGDI
jgi:hypothetical protein